MPRKLDANKLEKIRKVLKRHPNGLWIRELARMCNIDKSAVSRYMNKEMKDEVEIRKIGRLVKIVKLKR